jgi:hypothetical protein
MRGIAEKSAARERFLEEAGPRLASEHQATTAPNPYFLDPSVDVIMTLSILPAPPPLL